MSGFNQNEAGLFLMEMIVVTLFVSLMVLMSVRIFVNAKLMSEKSDVLTNGMTNVQTAAQLLKSGRGEMKPLQDYYGMTGHVVYFDEENQVCNEEKADFMMVVQQKEENEMVLNEITFGKRAEERSICAITTKVYREGE